MKLKKREKTLALVTAAMLALFGLQYAYSALRGPRSSLLRQKAAAAADVQRKQNTLKNIRLAAEKLEAWRERSLPANADTAQSLYQNWLLQVARDAKFTGTTVESAQKRRRGDVYHALRFTVQAATTIDGLTDFFHRFYDKGYLHQVLALTATPQDRGNTLQIQMTIEALSLTDAKQTSELSEAATDRKLSSRDVYLKTIGGRNLFAAYRPPPRQPSRPPSAPSSRPAPPRFDHAQHAYLTAVVSVNDRPQAWIVARTENKRFQLAENDEFRVGDAQCKVLRIGEREVEIEIDGQRRLLHIGESLRDSKPPPSP